ncbi:uncharacterized protein LOC129848530 [Salvelinus fontinalis]|uniref:uncharacterized protein LOC129848530 n=1 Tax=Salvelinus fontinalis TaxID=8038 RepID=UPI002485FFF1|nr:uncharacterized protein LOC129848530 [Salvelinus fontinalis]
MKEDRSDKDHREVERQTTLEEAVLETDIQTLSLEAEGEIEMQEADLKTDGTSQSQKVEGEIELDDAVAIPPQSQEVEGESELDDAVAIPPQSQEVEGESELDQAIVIPFQSQEEAKGESELNQVDLKTATSTLTLEVEGESVMQESDDLQTAGTSQSQETERVAKAAVVTFTSVTRKAAVSQTSLTLSRGKRSYPDLHTFVQDMKDGHWNLLSENMRAGMSRHEFSARCMDITNWVMESTSTVAIPALDLTMQIERSDSSSSSGSGSNEAREVTSLGRSVRFSFSGGPSRRTSSRTTCSTRTPTPFPSSHRYLPLSSSLIGTYPLLSKVLTPIPSSHRYLPLSPPLTGTYPYPLLS